MVSECFAPGSKTSTEHFVRLNEMLLPRAELVGELGGGFEAVFAFGEEIDIFGPGEDFGAAVLTEDAACVGGDDLDALEAGAFAAGVAADEALLRPVGAAGAALLAVEDEPHGPLPGLVFETHLLDVTLGEGAGGLVTLGGVVGDWEFFWLHGSRFKVS